jgi:hypothetical protein
MKICPVGTKLICLDEQTDIMKLKDTFLTSLNVPKKQVNTAYKRYSYVRAEKTEDDYIMG